MVRVCLNDESSSNCRYEAKNDTKSFYLMKEQSLKEAIEEG